MQDKLINKY